MSHPATSVSTLLGRETATSDYLPYSSHVSPHNIKTASGDMISVIKLAGVAHDAADPEDVAAWHEALHGMLKNAVDPDVAIWRHTVRRKNDYYPKGEFHDVFAQELNEKYRQQFSKHRMMQNDLYFTFVLKGEKAPMPLFRKKGDSDRVEVMRAIEHRSKRLDDLMSNALAGLSIYQPERLSIYDFQGRKFSEPLEFLGFLVNGSWSRRPLPHARIANVLASGRITFGVEAGEIRTVDSRKLFAIVSATDYPEVTETGDLTALLTVPFEIVVTHSFAYIAKQTALSMVDTQQKKLINTGDAASSQIDDLDALKEDLTANRVGMGEHDFCVLVTADDDATLVKRCSHVAAELAAAGFSGVVREDLALEAAYYAQLPGNFKYRPRPAPITTRNFAGLAALHNFPVGHAEGNQWGPAVSVLRTTAGSPYFINFHLPRRGKKINLKDDDDGEDRVAAHTLVVGPTGSGKTVDCTFLLAQAEKFKPTVFTFDKDYGQENFIRAQGGQYNVLTLGEATGWNPFHLEPTPRNIDFLNDLVVNCCGGEDAISEEQKSDIYTAIHGVLGLRYEDRQFSRLLEYLDPNESSGPHLRLQKWCSGGKNGWIFDNPTDNLSLSGTRHFGFDVTEFIDNEELRTAIVMYVYHRMESLIGSRRFIMVMEEFWKLLGVKAFSKKADDAVRTWRKRDAFAMFLTQGPREVLDSPIASSLIDACVTQIYKGNPKARYEDYVNGVHLSEREFEIIKKDMPESNMRGFLLKQGSDSVVCELNLGGMSEELAILSANSTSAALCRKAIARAGNNPELWMPVFHQYRRGL